MKGWYFRLSSLIKRNSSGLTLVELLIALSISGLAIAAATATINQLFWLGSRNQNHMVAVRQVQNAGYWISRDGVMAQGVTMGPSSGFPLTFSWTEWGTSQTTTVTYTLSDSVLSRQQTVDNATITSTIARYITSAQAEFPTGNEKLLTVTMTAQVGTLSETRTYKIKPRPVG